MRSIWEKFRAALGISGGGGEGQDDLISALPDDLLLVVLVRLPSAADAVRTSVLSRRWRPLGTQLPWLRFPHPADLARSRAALTSHAAPALLLLEVVTSSDADPGDAAGVLLLAAPRLTGVLVFRNPFPLDEVPRRAWTGGDIKLPCFEKAERIDLCLGYHGLPLPRYGVFAKLTVLNLYHVVFHGTCDLGDTLSSARCPSLRKLHVFDALGLSNFTLRSGSLIIMWLAYVQGLQKLTIVAPMLKNLTVFHCFSDAAGTRRQPVANISAPVLEALVWSDVYDMSSVQLGELTQLQELGTLCIVSYGHPEYPYNWDPVMLLQRFQKISILHLLITYPAGMVNCQYLIRAITMLPDIKLLHLRLFTCGHAIGSSVSYLLKICTSIRRLNLEIHEGIEVYFTLSEHAAISPACLCHQLRDWEIQELFLNSLKELDISGLSRADCDLAFVKRLLGWAVVLKTITINFHPSVAINEELCKELLHLSGPETCMKIYFYRNGAKVKYTPVG